MSTHLRLAPKVATHTILLLLVVVVFTPVAFAFVKATQDLNTSVSPSLAIGSELLPNLTTVFEMHDLGRIMLNTIIVVACVIVGKTTLSFLAASAFVFFRFPLNGALFAGVLFTLMLPTEILVVALYELVTDLGIYNTYGALIIPFLASATGTLLFRQHFMKVPRELLESAQLDGAGSLRALRSIVLPLSWNVIAAFAVIEFVYVWNIFLWPFLVIQEGSRQMVQVGLANLVTVQEVNHVGVVMAGVSASMIPPVIVFMFLQKRFLEGFSLSSER